MSIFNKDKDLLSAQEFCTELRNKLYESFNHYMNQDVHVSTQDRYNWDNKLDVNSSAASETSPGVMPVSAVKKLAGIEENANNYTHPISVVTPGSYISVEVDKNGHVISGSNPTNVDIKVSDSNKLDGLDSSYYAKLQNPKFIAAQTSEPQKDDDSLAIPTTSFLNKYYLKEAVVISDTAPTNRNVIWADSSEGLIKYFNGTVWSNISSKASSVFIVSEEPPVNYDVIWVKSTDYSINIYNGSQWICLTDSTAIVYSDMAPSNKAVWWYNTVDESMYYNNGTNWVKQESYNGGYIYSDTAPEDKRVLWVNKKDKSAYFHDGRTWELIDPSKGGYVYSETAPLDTKLLWITTKGVIMYYDTDINYWSNYKNYVVSSVAPDSNFIWFNENNEMLYSAKGRWINFDRMKNIHSYSLTEPVDKRTIWIKEDKTYHTYIGGWKEFIETEYIISSDSPDTLKENLLWVSPLNKFIKEYKGEWKEATDGYEVSGTAPSDTSKLWIDTSDEDKLKHYIEDEWVEETNEIVSGFVSGMEPPDNLNVLWLNGNSLKKYSDEEKTWVEYENYIVSPSAPSTYTKLWLDVVNNAVKKYVKNSWENINVYQGGYSTEKPEDLSKWWIDGTVLKSFNGSWEFYTKYEYEFSNDVSVVPINKLCTSNDTLFQYKGEWKGAPYITNPELEECVNEKSKETSDSCKQYTDSKTLSKMYDINLAVGTSLDVNLSEVFTGFDTSKDFPDVRVLVKDLDKSSSTYNKFVNTDMVKSVKDNYTELKTAYTIVYDDTAANVKVINELDQNLYIKASISIRKG